MTTGKQTLLSRRLLILAAPYFLSTFSIVIAAPEVQSRADPLSINVENGTLGGSSTREELLPLDIISPEDTVGPELKFRSPPLEMPESERLRPEEALRMKWEEAKQAANALPELEGKRANLPSYDDFLVAYRMSRSFTEFLDDKLRNDFKGDREAFAEAARREELGMYFDGHGTLQTYDHLLQLYEESVEKQANPSSWNPFKRFKNYRKGVKKSKIAARAMAKLDPSLQGWTRIDATQTNGKISYRFTPARRDRRVDKRLGKTEFIFADPPTTFNKGLESDPADVNLLISRLHIDKGLNVLKINLGHSGGIEEMQYLPRPLKLVRYLISKKYDIGIYTPRWSFIKKWFKATYVFPTKRDWAFGAVTGGVQLLLGAWVLHSVNPFLWNHGMPVVNYLHEIFPHIFKYLLPYSDKFSWVKPIGGGLFAFVVASHTTTYERFVKRGYESTKRQLIELPYALGIPIATFGFKIALKSGQVWLNAMAISYFNKQASTYMTQVPRWRKKYGLSRGTHFGVDDDKLEREGMAYIRFVIKTIGYETDAATGIPATSLLLGASPIVIGRMNNAYARNRMRKYIGLGREAARLNMRNGIFIRGIHSLQFLVSLRRKEIRKRVSHQTAFRVKRAYSNATSLKRCTFNLVALTQM